MHSGHSGRWARAALSVVLLALSPAVMTLPAAPAQAAAEPAPVVEAPDERSALVAAQRQGTQVEISGLRREDSQTFALPNGRLRLDKSLRPQRVRKTDGTWAAADATLRRGADGMVSPAASTMQMAFSGGGNTPMAAMTSAGRSVKLFWPSALPAPVLSGSVATYPSVLPGVDLQIRAEVDSFTHLVVIRTPKAAANPALARLALRTELSGLTLKVDPATDVVSAVDPSGATVFGGPSPSMWDSRDAEPIPAAAGLGGGPDKAASVPPAEPKRAPVDVELSPGRLVLKPDAAMLADPATVWPVYVDPTWNIHNGTMNSWTVLRASEPSRSFFNATSVGSNDATRGLVRAGRNTDGGVYRDRSLFNMKVGQVAYKQVFSATFSITQLWAFPACGGAGGIVDLREPKYTFGSGTTWNTGWNVDGSGYYPNPLGSTTAVRKAGTSCGPMRIEFSVTTYVRALAALGRVDGYFALRGRTETGDSEWKRYKLDPGLSILYNTIPNVPTGLSANGRGCGTQASPVWVTSATPTLAASVSDPDSMQQNLTTRFYWWQLGQGRTDANMMQQGTGNPGSPAKEVPAGRLLDDQVYVWQAAVFDDAGGQNWSGLCYLRVDSSPPNPPSSVSSPLYTASGPHGGVGVAGAFTFNPPATKPEEVVKYAYTLDNGVSAAAAPKVAANPTDRKAQVTLAPRWDGQNTLKVWTVDAADRASTTPFSYMFTVTTGTGDVALWQFDAPSACAAGDGSQHGNTLTVSGAACTAGRAAVGNALSLDGDDYAATSGPAMYPPAGGGAPIAFRTDADFTVAAWVRLNTTNTSRAVVAAIGTNTSAFWLGYESTQDKWVFRMQNSDVGVPSYATAQSDALVTSGRWTHLAGVFDAQTKKLTLFVNGEPQTATATLSAGFNATGPVEIGRRRWAGAADRYWFGAIDDVRLYQTEVPASAIDNLANPLPPVISFPNGTTAQAGAQIAIQFAAGGDTNVTSYKYGVTADGSTPLTATPSAPGQPIAVNVTATTPGTATVYAHTVDITNDASSVVSATFTVLPAASLSGTITAAADNAPIAGATVRLDPGDRTTTSASDGGFSFTGLTAGTYTLAAVLGDRCALFAATTVEVVGATESGLRLRPLGDDFGYTCRSETAAFAPADATVVPLSGDDAVAQVSLPFAVPHYDGTHTTAWVDTNGILSFEDPGGSHPANDANIPSPAEPNAMVAPYWDDLVVDASASVRTATLGSAPDRRFVVEWRNVHRKGDTALRVTFEAILGEDGTITFNYASLDGAAEQGEHAVVGIESPGGEIGIQYSFLEPALLSGTAIVFDFPGDPVAIGRFDLSGVVTDPAGAPVADTTVALLPADITVTTAADGRYTFSDLESGHYTAYVATGLRCGLYGLNEVELVGDTTTAHVGLARISDEAGTTCADGPRTFTPANDTVLALTGDEEFQQVNLPFPVPFYGQAYTSVWVDTNGVLAFENPFSATTGSAEIPSTGRPNAAAYPFWTDWWVDASASIRTATVGSAPNRQFIVEWRNVYRYGDPSLRVSFEAVLGENGQIAFAYDGIDAADIERGGDATVGIENADGQTGIQYLYHQVGLANGVGVVFQPGPPHTGTVAGTVTCNGSPVSGAQMVVAGQTVTTSAAGGYQVTGVLVGQYAVVATASSGPCQGSTSAPVTVTQDVTSVDMVLTAGAGYAVTVGPRTFTPASDTVLALTGDDAFEQISLPFPVTLYGQSYTTGWVDTNGVVAFEQPTASLWDISAIPSPAAANRPNAAVYPFWTDWWADASSSIRTATTGSAPNRQFIVEWRNVYRWGDPNLRVSFEVIFSENGDIAFAYDIGATFIAQGGDGTVGVENADGTIAVQYLHRHPALRAGDGLLFHPV